MKNFFLVFVLSFISVFSLATTVNVTPVTLIGSSATHNGVVTTQSQKSIATGSDGFARILAMDIDSTNESAILYTLKLFRCTNIACTTSVSHTVYQSTSAAGGTGTGCIQVDSGGEWALSLASDGTPRIAVQGGNFCPDETGPRADGLVLCLDASCASSAFTLIATDGYDNDVLSIGSSPLNDTSYIVFDYEVCSGPCTQGIKLATCVVGVCNSGTPTIPEFTASDCDAVSSVNVNSSGSPRFAYEDNICLGTAHVHYWANGSAILLASDGNSHVDMALAPDDTGRVAWVDSVGDIEYAQCTNSTCGSHNTALFVTPSNFAGTVSVAIGSNNFPRIQGFDSNFPGQTIVTQCKDDACTSSTSRLLDTGSGGGTAGVNSSVTVPTISGTTYENLVSEIAVGCIPFSCLSFTNTNASFLQITESNSADFIITAIPSIQVVQP